MPRHSTGCRTCVRRRLRCDESRPQCLRCIKLGQDCPGYRDPTCLVFVNETDQTCQLYRRPPLDSAVDPRSDSVEQREQLINPSTQLDLSAFSSLIYQAFLLNRFVSTGGQYVDHMTNKVWINIALSEPEKYPLAARSVSALSECFYGRLHSQKEIVTASIRSYSSTIHRLRQTLEEGKLCLSYDTLAAIAGLYYFECLAFTSSNAWLQHAEALAGLIESKGWQAFQTLPESSILEAVREPLIYAALVSRKRTFLEEDEWKMRWDVDDILCHHIADLQFLYAQIPRITRDILFLEESPQRGAPDLNFVEKVRDEIEDVQRGLKTWLCSWNEHYDQTRTRVALSTFKSPILREGTTLNEVFDFDDLKIAKVFVNYWTLNILASFQLLKIKRLSLEKSTDYQSLKGSEGTSAMAINICRSIPFFLQPVHIEAASFYIGVPMRVAYLALPTHSAEAQQLVSWRDYLSHRTGNGMLRNIIDNIPMRRAQPKEKV